MEANDKRELLPDQRVKRIREAESKNSPRTGSIYYHPAYSKMVPKCIDLSCHRPLHAMANECSRQPESKKSVEKWVEAYLVRQAKMNDWILRLHDKEFRLLFSQLNFKRKGKRNPQPLDLLAWDDRARHLVVLELKAGKHGRRLTEARNELKRYVPEIDSIRMRLAEVFSLGDVAGVLGYVVWPKNDRGRKHDLGDWGLIEYELTDEPWNEFTETAGRLVIDFKIVRQARVHIFEGTE